MREHIRPGFEFDPGTHTYYLDGKRATGITTIIGVLAKPNLIPWAARMAVEHVERIGVDCEHFIKRDLLLETTAEGLDQYLVITRSGLADAKNVHTKKKEAAGAHGTDAHALVEEWINGEIDRYRTTVDLETDTLKVVLDVPEKYEPIRPFIEWAAENVDRFLFSERRMADPELFIAGTADFAYIDKQGRKMMADFKTSSGVYGVDYWLQTAAYRMLAEKEGDEPYDGCTVVRLGKKGPTDFDVHHLFDYETYRDAFLAALTIYRAQAAIKGLTVH